MADTRELTPFRLRSVRARPRSAPPKGTPLSPQDTIDRRIDVFAQRALVRLSKSQPTSGDAVGLLSEIRAGRLAGIYKEDERVPAMRARALGRTWWTLIPSREDAALVLDPSGPGGLPIVVFRDRVRSNAPRLDRALSRAWAAYRDWAPRRFTCRAAPTGGSALSTEVSGRLRDSASQPMLALVVPPIICQTRVPVRLGAPPTLRGGTFIQILQGGQTVRRPALPHLGFFDITIGEIFVGALNLSVRFEEAGRWEVGVVQNVVAHQGELVYRDGVVRWFSGASFLDVVDGAIDIWGPAPPTPVPLGRTMVSFDNPARITIGPGGSVVGPINIALSDQVQISLLGTGECGPLLGGSVAVMFEAGIAARLGTRLTWLATSRKPYGFIVGLTVHPNGDADISPIAIGKICEILAAPPSNRLVIRPPSANHFTRILVRGAFRRASLTCEGRERRGSRSRQ
jgi:hypothetical protein